MYVDFYKVMADKTIVSSPCDCPDETCNVFTGTVFVVNYYDMSVRIRNDKGYAEWFDMDTVTLNSLVAA